MAALATQSLGAAGGAITLAAATGGGDTIEASQLAGGWAQATFLVVTVGATATTVTLDGTAGSALTSQTAIYLVPNGVRGSRKNITYSQVTGVTVGAVSLSTRGYASYGT
jgi:hypothetical protein